MKTLATTVISIAFYLTMSAQNGVIKHGHKMYSEMAYAKAIDLYEYAVEKNVKDPMVFRNLASSYEKIRDFSNASKYYAQLVVMEGVESNDYYRYAQNLKSTGNYEESKVWMAKYLENQPGDSRASKHKEAGDYDIDLKKDADRFKIENLDINSPGMDWGTCLIKNKVVFASNRGEKVGVKMSHSWNERNFLDLYEGVVDEKGYIKGIRVLPGDLNSKYHEGGSCFSPDGKTLWFTRNNFYEKKLVKNSNKIVNLKLYSVTQNRKDEWSNELNFPYNSDDYSVGHPTLSKNGRVMYFTSDMPGGMGGDDIWMSKMDNTGEWSLPVNCGNQINTEGDEKFPFIAEDGTLYFSSDGHVGLGGLDIYSAVDNNGKWMVENMGYPLNGSWDDFAMILRNEREGYFSSNRPGGKGGDDIYKFSFDPKSTLSITGVIVNTETARPIANAMAILVDENGNKLEEIKVGENGEFFFDLDPEKCNYRVMVNNGEGWTTGQTRNTPCDPKESVINEGNIELTEIVYGASGVIRDKSSNGPVKDFTVILMNNEGDPIESKLTSPEGKVEFSLDADTDYKIRFEKDGYLAKNGQFTTSGMQPGIIDINKFVDLYFETVEVGKVFEIENIFFDVSKADIRPDAALELDKIVTIMNENPTMIIELGSHTDSRGSDKYNKDLSDKRAKSSAAYIVSKGIDATRISGKGYGETQLKNKCANGVKCSDAEHQINRRTEFKIVKF